MTTAVISETEAAANEVRRLKDELDRLNQQIADLEAQRVVAGAQFNIALRVYSNLKGKNQ